ncbi:hypothetical protein CCACVL1_26237 [Corchorus capsularis]|uniref:Protein kinase domain-containing protein n=1 Tax=Corchorus capsularis TaxID=210143 RepID=A0A1R3GFG7_COCAP|nr:hypothetical protein CCACVL1_26237 [Corchorus capsularis]
MGNLGLAEMQIALASRFASFDLESSPHRSAFQWGGTIFALSLIQAQQPYAGKKTTDCANPDTSDSVLGYTCNGLNRTCQSYLVFRSQPSYNTVTSISNLLSADPTQVAEINEVPEAASFETNQLVIVPVNCSCSGDFYQNPPSKITVPPPPPPPPPSSSLTPPSPPSGSSNRTWVYVLAGVLGGAAVLLIVGVVIFCVFFRKSRKNPILVVSSNPSESFEAIAKKKKLQDESQSLDFLDSMSSIAQSLNLKMYKFEELQVATDNFSSSSQIKGSVYRGVIQGDFAAIKKGNGDVSKEIELLNKVNHSNLIRLSGVCFHDGHWYLVYEYAANGALSDWIFHSDNSGKFLSWKQRIQIALDVATGLNYLHSFTNPPHIHKDLKSSNVLLDGDFRAKLANFALARSTEGEEGQFALTRHIVGTKGYMAPEYLENGLVSTKLDVYAFGVLLLEIVTGKEASAFYGEEYMNLSEILNKVVQEKDGKEGLKQLIDPFLLENYPSELVIIVINLIHTCLKKDPTARPAMDEIVRSLSRILTTSSAFDSSSNMSWSQASTGSY